MSDIDALLVEDEIIIAIFTIEQLKLLGFHKIRHEISGEKALLAIEKSRPDLVFMDIGLPGKYDGIRTAEIIREKYSIPVVFLSSYNDEIIRKRAGETGPLGFLTKPMDTKLLLEILNKNFH
jgi:CheY-like chemotaxis protein